MQYQQTHFIGPKDCPFTFKGKNLVELRRSKLRQIAASVGVTEDNGTKNDLLGQIIVRLKSMESDHEIANVK